MKKLANMRKLLDHFDHDNPLEFKYVDFSILFNAQYPDLSKWIQDDCIKTEWKHNTGTNAVLVLESPMNGTQHEIHLYAQSSGAVTLSHKPFYNNMRPNLYMFLYCLREGGFLVPVINRRKNG